MNSDITNYEEMKSAIKEIAFRKKKKRVETSVKSNDPKGFNVIYEDDDEPEKDNNVRNHGEVVAWKKWHENKYNEPNSTEPPITDKVSQYLKLLSTDGWDLADKEYVRTIVKKYVSKSYFKEQIRHPSGDGDIDLQRLFTVKNLKNPIEDDDATSKQFVLNSIRDDAIHLKRKGDIMTGNIDMGGNSSIVNLDDKEFNPPDTNVATVGYVNRKVDSYIPKANLNIICSQGFKGKKQKDSIVDDVYKFFPAGIVFPTDVCIQKISLTTTNDPISNSKHKLRMIVSDPLNQSEPSHMEDVLEKLGSQLFHSQFVKKSVGNKKISFQLDSYSGLTQSTIFSGESTLTLEISV